MPTKSIRYELGDPEDYNPITLKRYSEPELRAEYSRLRRIARNRLRRIEASSDFGDSPIVTNNRQWLDIKPSNIPAAELPSMLSQVESLLEAKTGTLSGLRKQRALTIESLKDRGIRGINSQNFGAFTQFMQRTNIFREAYIPYPRRSKGSETRDAARQVRPRMFMLTEKGNVSEAAIMKEFTFFRDNLDKIEGLIKQQRLNPDRGRPYSANELRKMLGMQAEQNRSVREARTEARALVPDKPRKGKRKR